MDKFLYLYLFLILIYIFPFYTSEKTPNNENINETLNNDTYKSEEQVDPYKHFDFATPFQVKTFISEKEFNDWRKNMFE